MGDSSTYQHPVALQWDLGPERLKEVKNKLLLHFQSKKKSNGGECELRDLDCSQGYILIHFRQESVRNRVLQKKLHMLQLPNGETLEMVVMLPEETDPSGNRQEQTASVGSSSRPSLRNPDATTEEADHETEEPLTTRVVIENVQGGCTLEVLNLLVENVSNLSEDQDFHVEMIPEICSAVVTFTSPIDTCEFAVKFSRSGRATEMTAKPLEETHSAMVEDLSPSTSEEHLTLYFESPKHGGGEVQDVMLVPGEEAAIITFHDRGVLETVLKKQHEIGKKPVSVYPYHPSLGVPLYGKRGPCITMPKPIEFPVSPYVLEFIQRDKQIKLSIEGKMADKYCDITWPEPDCPNPAIKLSISRTKSTHLRTMARIVRAWAEQVSTEFSLAVSKYKVTEHNVNASVWEAIKEQVTSSAYERVLVKPDFAKEKVFLAGFSKDVTNIEQTFRGLVENTRGQIERKTQSVTESVPLAPALYEIMCKNGLEKNILKDFPDLKMNYDEASKCIKLHGLKGETTNGKWEIVHLKQQLKTKNINLNPQITEFLNTNDPDEMSRLLFLGHNINTMLQIEGDDVTLTALSAKDLTEAEKRMKCELVCKRVPVEDKRVTQSTEWRSLTSHLCEAFNSERVSVLIEEFPPGAENQLVIAGLSSAAEDTYQQLQDFLEKNTPVQKDIPVKSMAVMKFLMEERKEILMEMKKNVKVEPKQKSLSLYGPKLYMEEAVALIQSVLSSLYSDTLSIDKPGAKKFCLSSEEMHVTTARTKFNCVVHLQKDGEDGVTVDEVNLGEPYCRIKLPDGVIIAVYKDDLTRHCADVVVNAANEDLKHIGGLALALLRAAGPSLQSDSNDIVRRKGVLSAGDAVITGAGNLPCKQVIHTVGPRWDSKSHKKCERQLRKAIMRCLDLAAENGHTSIGIPAVSSGIFGFPLKQCVECIVDSIREYLEKQEEVISIKKINLVDNDIRTVQAFTDALRAEFGDQIIQVKLMPADILKRKEREKPRANVRTSNEMMMSVNGLTIKLVQRNIQDAQTDVIVNSVGQDLDLDKGGACKALFSRAGPQLQNLLNAESLRESSVREGYVFQTDGCDLSCDKVLHVVTPRWDRGKGSSNKVLSHIIKRCLKMTEKLQLTSISFPAIGTGNLGFPKAQVAAIMFDEVLYFCNKGNAKNLQEVHFVCNPSDSETFKAFSSEMAKYRGGGSSDGGSAKASSGNHSTFFGTVVTTALGVHEMKLGAITYQVKTGDITKEDTDVIVNSTDQSFTLQTGVSNAILIAAGPRVIQECAVAASLQSHKGYIITQSGNLPHKQILHVVGQTDPARIKTCVLNALLELDKQKFTSVAFPAIGTGAGRVPPPAVADAILDAVADFAKSAQCLHTVKVVIFQQQMLNDFYTSMKQKEGTALSAPESLFNKFTSFFVLQKKKPVQKLSAFQLMDNIEPASLHICGPSREAVKMTSLWLQKVILDEQAENVLTDETIADFEEEDLERLRHLQKKLHVFIEYKPQSSSVAVSGLTRDVLKVYQEIQAMVNKKKDLKTQEREADLCLNLVEWKYHDGVNFATFDKFTNLLLERASNEKKTTVEITINQTKYTVDVARKSARDNRGKTLQIEKVIKFGNSLNLPAHWDQMNSQVEVVSLNPGTQEYSDVEQQFARTCPMSINKIERIQNQPLWLNYQIKKQSMDTKNGNTKNEKLLFHGTAPDTLKNINHNGFNRSFAGKNAAMIGNGTYFAVNANYSAQDIYSRRDANGYKYVYVARVLTGMSCIGQQGMVAPPPKNPSDPTNLYDSITDNVRQPSMYVIFNDIQAYPEYLITFT